MAKRKPLVFIAGEIVESKATDTVDGSNIVITATGSTEERPLKDRFGDFVNVKDFGAKGNGTTDDTAAFQAAKAAADQRNAVVYVPDGTYKVTEPIVGEFISLGHPTFVGGGSVTFLTDLYNDYVHKTKNVDESITGDKTFAGHTTFSGPTTNNGNESHKGTETHEGNETHGKATGTTLTYHGTEVHDGQETHKGAEVHEGNETHGKASGTTLTYHGTEVHDGNETHGKATGTTLTYNGTEIHNGPETHSGTETHNGAVTFNGDVNLSNDARETLIENLLASENNGFVALTDTNNKLRVNPNEFVKANSGLTTEAQNNINKLKIDLSDANATTLNAITSYIIVPEGGLSVDPTTKKLKVTSQNLTIEQLLAFCDPTGGIVLNTTTGSAGYGKLKIDFSSIDPAILQAIVYAMVQQGGGLAVDSNGQIYVDFENMPTNKFEALLKSLKMLVPLTSNKTFYVDTNNNAASDTLDDGRGTASKPFKTINACVRYITSTYSLGNYHVTIKVGTGTYNENVNLPEFARGTGYIAIIPESQQKDVIVNAVTTDSGICGTCFSATGGDWRLYYMDARRVESPTTARSQTPSIYYANNASTVLRLYGCSATQSMPSSPSPLGGEDFTVRVFEADNGATLRFEHSVMAGAISVQKPVSGTPEIHVLAAERNGTILLTKSYDSTNDPVTTNVINCSGSFDYFVRLRLGGYIKVVANGDLITFTETQTMSGQKYALSEGSSIATGEGTSFFPGTIAGTLENGENGSRQTYCWYT